MPGLFLFAVLLADDFSVCGRDRDAFEASAVEVKNDFEVLTADTKATEVFAGGIVGVECFRCDCAGHHFLRDKNGESLKAFP